MRLVLINNDGDGVFELDDMESWDLTDKGQISKLIKRISESIEKASTYEEK